jgi:copper oxidase (laccase) domain-containing protein
VLEATVAALCEAAGCEPSSLEVWLGPCIGPRQFEVGADVLAGFGVHQGSSSPFFVPVDSGHWIADLAGLARDRLGRLGLSRISGGTWCTVEDASRFFSFRRDRPAFGNSGRMAAAIWIERR